MPHTVLSCDDKQNRVVDMKLYLKRDISPDGGGFEVFDALGSLKYTVSVLTERQKQQLIIKQVSGGMVAEIYNKSFLMRYFTVRCKTGFYILMPSMRPCLSFRIYGSTCMFAGDIASGRFSLYDVDKSSVMTQKKCWTKFGNGSELDIYIEEQEHFALSCALCAELFISASEEDRVPTG